MSDSHGTVSRGPRLCLKRLALVGALAASGIADADDASMSLLRDPNSIAIEPIEFLQPEDTASSDGSLALDGEGSVLEQAARAAPRFGDAGSQWWTIGGAYANEFGDSNDFNIHGAWTYFVAEDIEFTFETAAWAFFQDEGSDAVGINPNLIFRWHFLHAEDKRWTVYGDIGVGALFSTDDVPSGGTSVNFTPRVGVGFTHELPGTSARLQAGLRWHHVSNARFSGEDRNPARDAPLVYFGVTWRH